MWMKTYLLDVKDELCEVDLIAEVEKIFLTKKYISKIDKLILKYYPSDYDSLEELVTLRDEALDELNKLTRKSKTKTALEQSIARLDKFIHERNKGKRKKEFIHYVPKRLMREVGYSFVE